MSLLDELDFVHKIPRTTASGKSPLERAREKFVNDVDDQIEMQRGTTAADQTNPTTETSETKKRKPRSWVKIIDDDAYITPRVSNKPLPIGGKKGSVIRVACDQIIRTLETLQSWAQTPDAEAVILKAVTDAKRRKKRQPASNGGQSTRPEESTASDQNPIHQPPHGTPHTSE